MSTYDDDNMTEDAADEETEDTGFVGTGGPASVLYGDEDDERADEAGEEMLQAPDDESD